MKFYKWIWQDLSRHWGWTLFFIINLTLGLSGFVAVEAYRSAIENHLKSNAKNILAADLSISARRSISDEEFNNVQGVVGQQTPFSLTYEFFAMLNVGEKESANSRLVLVKVIDDEFPFYGELQMGSGRKLQNKTFQNELKDYQLWMYPELQSQLNLKLNQNLQLGKLSLRFTDTVTKDSTMTFRSATVAPRVFIHRQLLKESGLIQYGSTYSMNYLFRLNPDVKSIDLRQRILQKITDPAVQVDTADTAGEDSGRQLNYLTDYLGLVSIIALILSIVGAAYIFNLFLSKKIFDISILQVLGVQAYKALWMYIGEIVVLGFLSFVAATAVSFVFLPLLSNTMKQWIPFDLEPQISWANLGLGCMVSIIGSLLIALPFLIKIKNLRPARLIAEARFEQEGFKGIYQILVFIPSLLFFWILSVYQAHSLNTGSLFIGFLLVLVAVIYLVTLSQIYLFNKIFQKSKWFIKYSLLGLQRKSGSTIALVMALSLGALMINILPQLKATLMSEFIIGDKSKLPSLFMFDIQDEQAEGVKSIAKDLTQTDTTLYPLIRARILKINDQDFERKALSGAFKTREEELEARFRNRGVNLSYRPALLSSETIVEGKDFSPQTQAKLGLGDKNSTVAEISVENKFAKRVGLKIDDQVLFDVQGIQVLAKVVNLRSVRWASFNPNFFILIQPGFLEEAPKTFIGAIPYLNNAEKNQLQQSLSQKFPNISILDVGRTIKDILNTAEQMSWSLELMAALGIVTGYIVLISILRSQLRTRRWELNLLKVLGASENDLRWFLFLEIGFIAFFCSLLGVLGSFVFSAGLAIFVFDIQPHFSFVWPLVSIVSMTGLSIFLAYFIARSFLKENPQSILRAE
ncbi:MAG: ABC transporter permease [Pseudobdellovibrionaceae bacterium]